jgi:S-adenosylmethionine/arginine decarboxylase-like enzyme
MYNKFGKHLIVDFKGSNLVDNETVIHDFVDDLVDNLKMTKYKELHCMKFGESEKVAGYSFFQLIMESNISGHLCSYDYEMVDKDGNTYSNKGAGYIDIFSCKDYDEKEALQIVDKHFKPKSYTYKVIDRV